jgi:hypothetical protein
LSEVLEILLDTFLTRMFEDDLWSYLSAVGLPCLPLFMLVTRFGAPSILRVLTFGGSADESLLTNVTYCAVRAIDFLIGVSGTEKSDCEIGFEPPCI